MLADGDACFVCLETRKGTLVDLYKEDVDRISFFDKIKFVVTSEIKDRANMEICNGCLIKLKIAFLFKKMVLESQAKLFSASFEKDTNEIPENLLATNLTTEIKVCTDDIKQELFYGDNIDESEVAEVSNSSNEGTCDEDLNMMSQSEENPEDNCDASDRSDNSEETYVCSLCNSILNKSEFLNGHSCVKNDSHKTELEDGLYKRATDDEKKSNNTRKSNRRKANHNLSERADLIEEVYCCWLCELGFNKRWELQKHVIRAHAEKKKFTCTYCKRGFKQSYHLKEHITTHTGERKHSCHICGKTFQRLSSQRRHIKAHEAAPGQKTKRTPFLCTICGKSFPFSNGVQRHMRTHLGIRMHQCVVCKRKFTQSTHLHVHMRTHTGEKPYVCETCGEAFPLNVTLQKHLSIHEAFKPPKQTDCEEYA